MSSQSISMRDIHEKLLETIDHNIQTTGEIVRILFEKSNLKSKHDIDSDSDDSFSSFESGRIHKSMRSENDCVCVVNDEDNVSPNTSMVLPSQQDQQQKQQS